MEQRFHSFAPLAQLQAHWIARDLPERAVHAAESLALYLMVCAFWGLILYTAIRAAVR